MIKPIKRSRQLVHLSHEHHDGLLFCWKLRKGLSENIDPKRMRQYVKWFYQNHIIPHFEEEEKILFPILGPENNLIKRALKDHAKLVDLFKSEKDLKINFASIAKILDDHIRFEERILFGEIEFFAKSNNKELPEVGSKPVVCEAWKDEFWVIKQSGKSIS